MNIIIKKHLLYSVAYDNQKNVLCRIKNSLLGNRENYIYDSKNNLRYITKIYNTKDVETYMDFHKFQIVKIDSGIKDIVGVADLEYMDFMEGNSEKEFIFRAPMMNRLVIRLNQNNQKFKVYLKRDGSCFIKNEKDLMVGSIKKQKRKVNIDMNIDLNIDTLDECLLCAIYELTRYLDAENEFLLV